ncbi:MAG TPA: tripartite tricarboxylate transporter substrate binding protein [Burkholderiales bacterium]|nr:tripartite tricarboxylate transporter substrate binding protein [Burkholderiales bacterium]
MRTASVVAIGALSLGVAAPQAFAQAQYPSQQIRIVCPFPAGGGTDLTARILADQLNKIFSQPVVVDNRTGASGMIGTDVVAKAKPDGYTLLLASGEIALNPHLYPKMAYDWDRDLQPITLMVKVANVMAVHVDVPAKNVKELIAYAKQNPGKLTFSSSGVGNPQQLTGEMFNKMAGVQIRHVPYKGAAPQLAALAGHEVTLTYVSIGAALPFIQSNRIRPIGVTSTTRVSALPDVPPISDTLPGFELVNFFGFFGPAGLPAPILQRLNSAAVQVLKTPEVANKFRAVGFEPAPTAPEEFRKFIRGESAKFANIIKEAGIKLQE